MSDVLVELQRIAQAAALVVLEVYESPFTVDYKGPQDPVTDADRRANELICRELERAFPGVPIVAEESLPESFANFRASSEVFFVDPVDGTREFVNRNGEFVVMIGLVEGARATTSVIQAPALGLSWGARVGEGAWVTDLAGTRTPIQASQNPEMRLARGVASRSKRVDHLERAASFLGAKEVVPLGSMGLKAVEVARGLADLYVAPGNAGKLWDACACDALVTAAGGRFSDMTGQPIDYRAESLVNSNGIVASNALLHDSILARLHAARPA